jgi:hypothetical protein
MLQHSATHIAPWLLDHPLSQMMRAADAGFDRNAEASS